MEESGPPESRLERAERRVDDLMARASKRKVKSLRRTGVRPLKTEILRTGYLVGCILVDLIVVPVLLESVMGWPWYLVLALPAVLLLAYLQLLAHKQWFPLPEAKEADSG